MLLDDLNGYLEVAKPSKMNNFRQYYRGKPLLLAEEAYGIYFPPKPIDDGVPGIRELIEDVCLMRVTRAVGKAPRGGGKSFGCAFCEWYHNYFNNFDWINLGGAEKQAKAVYNYIEGFVNSHHQIASYYPKGTLMTNTENMSGAWISVLAASPTSIRSPHAGGINIGDITARLEGEETGFKYLGGSRRGGGLTIDEECEADPNIVRDATPMVDTADPSIILRISTFHKLEGTFEELIDNHEEMGYKLYSWDSFDICQPCTHDCDSCLQDFREDIYISDVNTGNQVLKHKAYCGGKAKLSQGWMSISEIKQQFREHNFDCAWFETEMMGWRPATSGHVIKDQYKFVNSCVVDDDQVEHMPGCQCVITIDWGMKGECCVQVWQIQPGAVVALLEDDHYIHGEPENFIYESVYGLGTRYKTNEVWADSSHPYCNNTLMTHPRYRMDVREVNFRQEKELGAGAFNAWVDLDRVKVPKKFNVFIKQVRNWKRKTGKIQKGDDHGCDAAICFFLRFAAESIPSSSRIMPITFSPGLYIPGKSQVVRPVNNSFNGGGHVNIR
jgi:hypothetical protein